MFIICFFILAALIRGLIWRGQFYYLDEFLSIKNMRKTQYFIFWRIGLRRFGAKNTRKLSLYASRSLLKIPSIVVVVGYAILELTLSQQSVKIDVVDWVFICSGAFIYLPPFVNSLLIPVI
ncbi:MAG: hypothetical protein R2827_04805 [Bdellovibrionales bacterium]